MKIDYESIIRSVYKTKVMQSLKCLSLSECTTNNAFFNRKQKQTEEGEKT